ncbi:MAG: hypothetical protein CMF46_04915 [Legionellales bacterium]|nr:hypothetical protein [Legionellales bacterium]
MNWMTPMTKYPPVWQGGSIVALSSLFYLYEFFLRVSPTVITHELMHHFSIDALQLSFIASAFYIGYTPMQIPAGKLCNQFNLRYILATAMAASSLACLCFSLTDSYLMAIVWRIVIGILSAFAFVGPLMLTRRMLEAKYFAITTGLIQFSGCLGATIGLEPFSQANKLFGWQTTLGYTAMIGLIIALIFVILIKDEHNLTSPEEPSHASGFILLKDKQIWMIAINAFCCWAPIAILGELWGVKLIDLKWSGGLKPEITMNYFWLGVAIASPLAGWLSDRIQSRKKPLKLCFILSFIGSVVLIYFPAISTTLEKCLLFTIGASVAAQTLTFAMVNDYCPDNMAGFAYGFNNVAVISSGILLPPISGFILTMVSDGNQINGVPFYSLENFMHGLAILPIISIVGIISSHLVTETYRANA